MVIIMVAMDTPAISMVITMVTMDTVSIPTNTMATITIALHIPPDLLMDMLE
jgi:hypothetical protein